MKYMLLVYSKETEERSPEQMAAIMAGHRAVQEETASKGILVSCAPLAETSTATTVRQVDGKPMIVDGPFAETKEQLAGYYILDCANLDEAIEWASRLPTGCHGGAGCIEVRPLRFG